jgi:monofunctional glycosyltransferase
MRGWAERVRWEERWGSPRLRRRPRLRLLLWGLGACTLLPACPIAALRWVPPPTTAFIWAAERRDPQACTQLGYRWVPAEQIPSHVALAFLAAEDQSFWEHSGFDVASIRDAVESRVLHGRIRGASTVSQQLAKNLFLWERRSWLRKGLEAYLTVLLESMWPKRRILETYLNVAQLGRCTFGVGAASERFFGKRARDLSQREAALLAAVLPNPRERDARRPSVELLERASEIVAQMNNLRGTRVARGF